MHLFDMVGRSALPLLASHIPISTSAFSAPLREKNPSEKLRFDLLVATRTRKSMRLRFLLTAFNLKLKCGHGAPDIQVLVLREIWMFV
jgi:hypothetical protein